MATDSIFSTTETGHGLSQLKVAFAVALVRSKPDNIDIREYILQLRSHLKRPPPSRNDDKGQKIFDSANYWKERCEIAETKINTLELQIAELQRSKDSLQEKMDNRPTQEALPAKRKRDLDKSNKSAKRVKEIPKDADIIRLDAGEIDAATFYNLGEAGRNLAAQVFRAHRLRGQKGMDSQTLHAILGLTSAIVSVSNTVTKKPTAQPVPDRGILVISEFTNEDLSRVNDACTRSFILLLAILQDSSHTLEKHMIDTVIYECVALCGSLLESLKNTAQAQAAFVAKEMSMSKAKGRAKTKPSQNREGPFNTITSLLFHMISYLDRNVPAEREIFEGWLFLILKRTGDLLFYFTFGQARGITVEDDIGLLEERNVNREMDIGRSALQLEVIPLMIILKRALSLAPNHLNPRPIASSRKSSGPARTSSSRTLPSPSRATLIPCVKERLQRTLVMSMFGEEDQDELSNILRKPAKSTRLPKGPVLGDDEVGDWFQREVWKLVGWDLLSRKEEW